MIPVDKNKEYEVLIESVSGDGNGIAHIGGFAVFVPMCAAGDRLRIKIVKVKEHYAFARIEEIISPSEFRIEPECPHYKLCGGCNLMHIDYNAQLQIKLDTVRNALTRIGGVNGNIAAEIAGMENAEGYRNKMVFPAGMINGEIQFGFYRSRSHDLVPVNKCFISDAISESILVAVKKYMEISHTSVYDEKTKKGSVRRVFIRKGFSSGEIMVVICAANKKLKEKELLIKLLREVSGNICSIMLNIHTNPDNLILGEKNILLWGKEYIEDILCGLKYKISPHSFFQVNPVQTEILYNTVIQTAELNGNEKLLDVYCGIGTMSVMSAKYVKEVVGVEIVEQAVKDAEENAKINKTDNCRFIAGKAENVVPALMQSGFSPDVAIIDPPRKGCDTSTLNALISSSAEKIIYVSCNPSTLARDIKYFCINGFVLRSAKAVDMFPNTTHVEVVVLLCRSNT